MPRRKTLLIVLIVATIVAYVFISYNVNKNNNAETQSNVQILVSNSRTQFRKRLNRIVNSKKMYRKRTGVTKNGVRTTPNCLERRKSTDLQNVAKLNPSIWNEVKFMLFFIGHGRSGTTLVGSLLDAHPNIIVANEYDALQEWENFTKDQRNRDYLFQHHYAKSYEDTRTGFRSPDPTCYKTSQYMYAVPNQWQGKFDRVIKVVGNKKPGRFVAQLSLEVSQLTPGILNLNTLGKIQEAVKVPFKYIYVLRNPFDVAATMMLRRYSRRNEIADRNKLYVNPLHYSKTMQLTEVKELITAITGAASIMKHFSDDVIVIYTEDMAKNPTEELKKICEFLSVPCSREYLKDCSSIVNASPSKSRNAIFWDDEAKGLVTKIIQELPMLSRYKFHE